MAVSGSGSPLANNVARKAALSKVRTALLDGPGTKRRGGPPPPTVPAERPNPKEEALAEQRNIPNKDEPQPAPETQPGTEKPAHIFDDDTRGRLMQQVEPFLLEQKKQKLAQMHQRVGRIRRFWGGGL